MAERACEPAGMLRTQGVAIVLDEPKAVSLAESPDCIDIEWIPHRVRQHDGPCPFAAGLLQSGGVHIVRRQRDVDEHGDQSVLDQGGDRGGETCGDGDYLVPFTDPSAPELFRGEGGNGKKIRRGSGVGEDAMTDSKKLRKVFFEPVGIPPGGKPELQRGINEVRQFLVVENPAPIGDSGLSLDEFRCPVGFSVIFPDQCKDIIFYFVGLRHLNGPFPSTTRTFGMGRINIPPRSR